MTPDETYQLCADLHAFERRLENTTSISQETINELIEAIYEDIGRQTNRDLVREYRQDIWNRTYDDLHKKHPLGK